MTKAPPFASLFALAALRNSGLPIRRHIRILFGCNEEAGSDDIKYYLANGGGYPSWASPRTANIRSSTAKRALSM